MSKPKQQHVWPVFEGDQLSAVFSTEEMAREYTTMRNKAAEATTAEMKRLGFANYSQPHFTYTRKDLKRSLDS